MKCTCKTPNIGCKNAKPKIMGHYCSLDVETAEQVEIGSLRHGQRFSFIETPWRVHKAIERIPAGMQYLRCDDVKQTEENLKRIVNRL